ncbi:hypothetical protein BDY19DRAFT_642348 [Irpex rosettiformis]|uniref:Uncharacterized protein n=1 Tax=Irpex rosettiformis TaxID=378272 RepID=A0ACB8UBT9_9APHY|nr:hypothetical protein BDY19DRAFT_642348 [Irpex rosettiformis]
MAKVKTIIQSSSGRPRWILDAVLMPARRPRGKDKAVQQPQSITIDHANFTLSKVFYAFFPFVAERHAIFRKRLSGLPQPWTQEPILEQFPFTNVFRVLDRNSQYILRNVIRKGSQALNDMFFRVLLFRTFNKIETWEMLEKKLGPLNWKSFSLEKYERVLASARTALYNAAYIIPSPNLGHEKNYQNHLRMIETMMAVDRLPTQLGKLKHLKDVHGRIRMYLSMGDFMAMQLVLDLNMMPHYNWSEDEWVALGPGSRECLKKMFGPGIRGREVSAIRYIRDNQHSWFIHCGVTPDRVPRLHESRPPGLTMVDIEHALCECEKYSRGKFPTIKGKRVTVGKRIFAPRDGTVTADIPENWLNPAANHEEQFECPPPVDGTDDTYEVSHIVSENKSQYLIRWKGYGPESDSWIPAHRLGEGAGVLIDEWNQTKARINEGLLERAASQHDKYMLIKRLSRKTI